MSEAFFEAPGEEKKPKKKSAVSYSCERCGLCNQANTKDFSYVGEGKKKILIVGGMPSLKEDGSGNLGTGPEFNFLKDHFKENGVYILQDCWYTTAIRCRPYAGKSPNQVQVKSCQEKLESLITELKPKLIILLGELPFKSVIYPHLRGRIGGTQWTMFMGEIIPDQNRETYLAPISDPAYLLSKKRYNDGKYSKPLYERESGTYLIWKQQLAKILAHNNTFYKSNYASDCITSTKIEDAIKWLEEALNWEYVAFDFETTGIKPHREGHRIVCVSISNGMYSFGFPFFEDREFRRAWKRLMLSDVKKIAHNAMFENMWNHTLLGYYVDGWEADTMLLAHAYNSVKPCGLKFLTYVNFGVIGYDDSADPFLKATQEEVDKWGTNAFNQIDQAPIDDLIQYCAMDSLFTYKLWERMKGQFSEFQDDGNRFFLESAITLCKAQENGFCVDMGIFEQNRKHLLELQEELEDKIMKDPDVKKWDSEEVFNFKSTKQLGHLLFDILKIKPQGFTAGGAPAVDKEILPKYDVPFIAYILAWRRLEKIQQALDTYMKETVDGKIHSFTRLHGVDTMRSCVAKGTKILVARDYIQNPEGVNIEDVKVGDYVYSYGDDLKLTLKKVLWAGKTGHREVIRLHYNSGAGGKGYLDVTPEHKIRVESGEYVPAVNLLSGDYRDTSRKGWKHTSKCRVLSCKRYRDRLYPTNSEVILEHHFIYSSFTGEKLGQDEVIHHIDGNHSNHSFENLRKMKTKEHCLLHLSDIQKYRTEESFTRATATRRKRIEEGKIIIPVGYDNHSSLHLSKEECIAEFHKSGGRPSKTPYSFTAFRKCCAHHGIDLIYEKKFFNKEGEYLSAEKVYETLKSTSFMEASRILRIGTRKLQFICGEYNIAYDGPGKVTWNNHVITHIEFIQKSVDVYDLEVEDTHNFIANEICVHNSMGDVNLQNNFKRDKEASGFIRTAMKPSKGHKLVAWDYKSLEVMIGACHSQDPNMMRYVTDSTTDMHRDSSKDCFLLDDVPKDVRQAVKGMFVFAEMYGSYWGQVAVDLWEFAKTYTFENGTTMKQHLASKGIRNYEQFEKHIQKAEDILWQDRFPVHAKWRREMTQFYSDYGYVMLPTGFMCKGPMRKNNTFNTPVQGSAYHVCQWTMNRVQEEIEKRELNSRLLCEIHDCIVADVDPAEEAILDEIVWYWGTQGVKEHWPWITVELQMEREESEIDGSWAKMGNERMIGKVEFT